MWPKFYGNGVSFSLRKQMNRPSLYRLRGRWTLWIAFTCAVGIHLGVVVIAKTRSESTGVENFTPLEGDVEIIETESDAIPPVELATPPLLEQISPDQDFFSEESAKEPKIRVSKTGREIKRGSTTSLRSAKSTAMYAPPPVYPYEARRSRITGSGTALLTIDPASGNVIDVLLVQSCGNAILDHATLDALHRWRFKPRTAVRVKVPITYMLRGVSY